MSGLEQVPPIVWLGVVAFLVYRFVKWRIHLAWYPDRACSDCGGSGKVTSEDALGRKVIGPCRNRRCRASGPTTPRRRADR